MWTRSWPPSLLRWPVPGGLGSVSVSRQGVQVGALAVVNPIGDVLDEQGGVLAGPGMGPGAVAFTPGDVENTTLIAVVTEHTLTKAACRRLADAAHPPALRHGQGGGPDSVDFRIKLGVGVSRTPQHPEAPPCRTALSLTKTSP